MYATTHCIVSVSWAEIKLQSDLVRICLFAVSSGWPSNWPTKDVFVSFSFFFSLNNIWNLLWWCLKIECFRDIYLVIWAGEWWTVAVQQCEADDIISDDSPQPAACSLLTDDWLLVTRKLAQPFLIIMESSHKTGLLGVFDKIRIIHQMPPCFPNFVVQLGSLWYMAVGP